MEKTRGSIGWWRGFFTESEKGNKRQAEADTEGEAKFGVNGVIHFEKRHAKQDGDGAEHENDSENEPGFWGHASSLTWTAKRRKPSIKERRLVAQNRAGIDKGMKKGGR